MQVYYQMVDECIRSLGIDPNESRGEKEGQWNLRKGTASVWVDVFFDTHNNSGYIQVMGPVCKVPQNDTIPFYEELLQIGHNLFGVGFTKFNEWIYIKSLRETDDLQPREISAMLNRVGTYCDQYDDYFNNKYHNASSRKTDE